MKLRLMEYCELWRIYVLMCHSAPEHRIDTRLRIHQQDHSAVLLGIQLSILVNDCHQILQNQTLIFFCQRYRISLGKSIQLDSGCCFQKAIYLLSTGMKILDDNHRARHSNIHYRLYIHKEWEDICRVDFINADRG